MSTAALALGGRDRWVWSISDYRRRSAAHRPFTKEEIAFLRSRASVSDGARCSESVHHFESESAFSKYDTMHSWTFSITEKP